MESKYIIVERRPYGFWRFLLDLFLIGITSGLWLLWIILKFLRTGRR